jgi:hypothetical protein
MSLSIWTLYDHPLDAPQFFVLRRWETDARGARASPELYACEAVEPLREKMRERGLVCLPRQPEDDPKIIESWI